MLQLSRTEDIGGYATPKRAKSGSQPPSPAQAMGRVWHRLVKSVQSLHILLLINYSAPMAQEQMRFEEI
jgi:hypothetical protein